MSDIFIAESDPGPQLRTPSLLIIFNMAILMASSKVQPITELEKLEQAGHSIAALTGPVSSQEERSLYDYMRGRVFSLNTRGLRQAREQFGQSAQGTLIIENLQKNIPAWQQEGVFIVGYLNQNRSAPNIYAFESAGAHVVIDNLREVHELVPCMLKAAKSGLTL